MRKQDPKIDNSINAQIKKANCKCSTWEGQNQCQFQDQRIIRIQKIISLQSDLKVFGNQEIKKISSMWCHTESSMIVKQNVVNVISTYMNESKETDSSGTGTYIYVDNKMLMRVSYYICKTKYIPKTQNLDKGQVIFSWGLIIRQITDKISDEFLRSLIESLNVDLRSRMQIYQATKRDLGL